MAKRVRNEVALHRRLSHPNVLALYHYFEDDDRVYLVMELCAKGEVYTLLRRRREAGQATILSEAEGRSILRDVVAGLRFLHSSGIIHRDLKLSNILLSEGGQAKIADFGLAVGVDASTTANDSIDHDSLERTICGTPNYLAPEIVSKRRYGRSADIWSLGCLLYSFLVGRPPFDSADLPSTFEKVKNHDYSIPEFISPAARDLITRLLSPNPADRPNFDQIIFHPFFNPAVTLPLQTRRLSPLKQATKYGTIEIKADGTVRVDFLDAPDLVIVSADGLFVQVQSKTSSSCVNTFSMAKLPESYKKRYEYARRFVNLVRSKTPLIVLSTARFKAYLMENAFFSANTGDFHLHYRDGRLKLDYCWVSRQLRFVDGQTGSVKYCLSDPSLQVISTLNDPLLREGLAEFLARYRQCQQVRDAILHPDGLERGSLKLGQFPFVIKEDSSGEKENTVPLSSASRNSSLLNPFNTQSFSNASLQSMAPMQMNSTSSMSKALPVIPESTSPCLLSLQRKHLKGVGWCLSGEDDQFLMLFDDGYSLVVDGRDDCLVVEGGRRMKIDAQLPDEIKHRLALFNQFL